jgi:DGQHR domain-containing protein
MSLIIPAVQFRQRKVTMYLAAIPINCLHNFSIDIWNIKSVMGKRGYQRQPDERRIKKIAEFFNKPDSIMPAAGLLNVRTKGKMQYEDGKLIIPDNLPVWVVDMQHRLQGLRLALEHETLDPKDFFYPVVITEGLNPLEEAAQFYIINTKTKKMDVALTRRLLIENDEVSEIADVPEWEILAVQATIELNNRLDGPWRDAVRPPNSERLLSHIATEKSFVPSLRPFFVVGKSKQPRKTAKRLAALWRAIEENIPKAFDEPKKFLIQRTPGLFTFNFFIAPSFLHKFKDEEFVDKLSGLQKLGWEFWKRSNKSGARRFGTGMGAYAELAEHVKTFLPL